MFRLSLFLALVFCAPLLFARPADPSQPVIVAYVFQKDAVLKPGDIDPHSITRVNYAFADIKNGKMVEGFKADKENLAFLTSLRGKNPSLTVLISVGGWTWSGNFSDMALTTESRSAFIQSAVEFIQRHNLDGLDIDWEYPGMIGAGNRFRPEDKQNFTLLLKEFRARFDLEEKKLKRRLYLTIATGAQTEFLANTEMGKVQEYVDTVNLMTYDMYVPGPDSTTGHHSALRTNPKDPKGVSAERSVREYLQAGVPASKIVLGVPFYGKVWGDVPDQNHGLFQPGKEVPNAFSSYSVIAGTMLNKGYTRYWDAAAQVPYLYNAKKKIFVTYEDPESLALKCRYVRDQKLAGVMFWAYSSDTTGALLRAINANLRGPAATGVGSK